MSGTNFFRLIEAYFEGSISANDKLMLENQLDKDPLLKAEFNLQKNIQQGISNVRQQQLKQRLASIDVAPVSVNAIQSGAVKWLAGTIAAATILGGVLYWAMGDNNPIIPLDLQENQYLDLAEFGNQIVDLPTAITVNTIKEQLAELSMERSSNDNNMLALDVENKSYTENKEPTNIAIKPQSLISFEDEKLFINNSEDDIEKRKPIDVKMLEVKQTTIEVLLAREKNKFHYQYFSNKLFLYGNFDDEPYEIIELKQKGDRKLFLSYKEAVYIIEPDRTEITELQILNDAKLLHELEIISASK